MSRSVMSDSSGSHRRSPPGSSVRGISQARILEWVAISSSRGSSPPRDRTRISCVTSGYSLPSEPPGKPRLAVRFHKQATLGGDWKVGTRAVFLLICLSCLSLLLQLNTCQQQQRQQVSASCSFHTPDTASLLHSDARALLRGSGKAFWGKC